MDENGSAQTVPPGSDPAVFLDGISHQVPTLLTVLDPDGTVLYENHWITPLLGFDQSALVDEPVTDYLHPEDRQRFAETFQAVVSTDDRTVESVEYRHRTADGTYLWVESVVASEPTPDGNYVLSTHDISTHKQREQDLEATNERLEQFVRFISHDLRNPLSVAQGYLEVAHTESPNTHHEMVADALDRMNRLIDGLRSDTRLDQPALEPEPVDLEKLCVSCWQHVSTDDSRLETEVDNTITADRFRLMQLLENLFRNGIEHNDEAIRITVGELDDGFYVTDDGCGIPPEKQDQVFETGYTTADEGTGFGLDIVTQVVEAHDWNMLITESDTGGVRFEITGVQFSVAAAE